MASLYEYFVKDGAQNLTTRQEWPLTAPGGVTLGKVIARLHLDFEANARYISFFIPAIPDVACPEAFALNNVASILKWPETTVGVQAGFGEELRRAKS